MGANSQVHLRAKRVLLIVCALIIYVLLVVLNIQHFFLRTGMPPTLLLVSWTRLGFSALVALLFLSVGALVWLYARNRLMAGLLFCFCIAMMISFSVQTAAKGNDPLFSLDWAAQHR